MSNKLLSVEVHDRSILPSEAVLAVRVVPERLDPGTEVRGRFLGPRCRFASTIEVAYHLRPDPEGAGAGAIGMRAIIPEPSLWEPEAPHLYAGIVELWQDQSRCAVVEVRHGLRYFSLGARGLRWNGRPLPLRGVAIETLDDDVALALRQGGYNLVVAPVSVRARHVWEVADRIGLAVIGRLTEENPGLAVELSGHASSLGWLVPAGRPTPRGLPLGSLTGVDGEDRSGAAFIAVPPERLEEMTSDRPVLLLGSSSVAAEGRIILGGVALAAGSGT